MDYKVRRFERQEARAALRAFKIQEARFKGQGSGDKQAVRKAAAQPEVVRQQSGRFKHIEVCQFEVGYSSGEAFAGLLAGLMALSD